MMTVYKLTCDVCGKLYDTLGCYNEAGEDWFVCFRCFEIADAAAAKEDRWPNNKDFARLKELR